LGIAHRKNLKNKPDEKIRLTTTGATVSVLPAEREENFYVADPGKGLNAVRFPERINEMALKESSVGNRGGEFVLM
jgi:hypothetical protein